MTFTFIYIYTSRGFLHVDTSSAAAICRQLRADKAIGKLTALTSLYARQCIAFGSLAPLATLTQLLALDLNGARIVTLRDISG
jgi:hypothetical protein